MPELTRVHIALLKGKIIENVFKRVRGEARVSSGGAAGSVLIFGTFVVFCSFLQSVWSVRAYVECLSSSCAATCGACAWRRPRQLPSNFLCPCCLFSSFRVSQMLAGAWNSPLFNCVGLWAPRDVLEFQHLHYDGSSQGSSLGLVSDNVGVEAFNVLLFWIWVA